MDYFVDDVIPSWWNGELTLSTIKDVVDWRKTVTKLPCGNGFIPGDFHFNGASVGIFRKIPFFGFPKWKHPIATCRHDWRCNYAEQFKKSDPDLYKYLRKRGDKLFKADIKRGTITWKELKGRGFRSKVVGSVTIAQTWWEQQKGYVGVRIGAVF